jgi:hypothetical protein
MASKYLDKYKVIKENIPVFNMEMVNKFLSMYENIYKNGYDTVSKASRLDTLRNSIVELLIEKINASILEVNKESSTHFDKITPALCDVILYEFVLKAINKRTYVIKECDKCGHKNKINDVEYEIIMNDCPTEYNIDNKFTVGVINKEYPHFYPFLYKEIIKPDVYEYLEGINFIDSKKHMDNISKMVTDYRKSVYIRSTEKVSICSNEECLKKSSHIVEEHDAIYFILSTITKSMF